MHFLSFSLEVLKDKRIQPETELSDSEDEGTGGRRHRKDRKLTHPNAGHDVMAPSILAAGSEGPTLSSTERDTQENPMSNGEISNGDMTPQEVTEQPLSPSAPGLSMNAFGRPKMTAAAVGANEDMDVDDPMLPESTSRTADDD